MIPRHLSADDVVRSIQELPALPAVVLELIQSLGDARVSAEQLAVKISHDQAIAAKTLRLANSSFYGLARQISSIEESTAILGLRTLRSVAIAAGLVGSFAGIHCRGFDFAAFWRHAIGTAITARAIAQRVDIDEDAAFTLGLVHDIGRLVLVSTYDEDYAQAIEYRNSHDCLMYAAERHCFGLDHAQVGALLAEHWHFAPDTVAAIAAHHHPPGGIHLGLVDVVHVADNIAHALDLARLDDDLVPPLALQAWSRVRLQDDGYLQVFEVVEQQHEVLCHTLLA